jgi:hypothetical protein
MSEASRAIALQHAVATIGNTADHAAVLTAAEAYHSFITGNAEAPAKPVKASKPAAPVKQATKPVEADTAADEDGVTKEQVGEAIEAMLNANMRTQAVALFAKYKAKSLSGVKTEDYAAIKQDAEDALLNA